MSASQNITVSALSSIIDANNPLTGFRRVRSLIYNQLFYKPFNFLEL